MSGFGNQNLMSENIEIGGYQVWVGIRDDGVYIRVDGGPWVKVAEKSPLRYEGEYAVGSDPKDQDRGLHDNSINEWWDANKSD